MSVSFLNEMHWRISGFQASNRPVARLLQCHQLIIVEEYHEETTGEGALEAAHMQCRWCIGKPRESLLPVFFFLLSYNDSSFRKSSSLETCSETDIFWSVLSSVFSLRIGCCLGRCKRPKDLA